MTTETTNAISSLQRIEQFVDRFFSHRDVAGIDRHELAMSLWDEEQSTGRQMALSIVRLRCISALRSAQHPDPPERLVIVIDLPVIREQVNVLTSDLRPFSRHLLYLRFWRGLTLRQMASELHWSEKVLRREFGNILHQLRLRAEQKGLYAQP